ncbi:MAG: tripartite tricarboxylate transporter substrate binding protein [Rubrivivax sp.]|nr:tripartite tricarboxylate transporter substrate binding protein [Rubrivivax sp.]
MAMNPERRLWLRRLAGGTLAPLATGAAARALAQAPDRFPQRPITLWVPWPPGGATDLTMRLLAELAGRQLGQKVIVENRSGAGGTMAMPILQQAAPDGYTIAQVPQPVFRAPLVQKLLWDPIRDTTPIIQISGVTFGLVVPANSPWRSFDDVLAYARSHPGQLTLATNGVGTTPHVVLDEFFARKGLPWVHVPYKGTAEQMIAVASGQVMAGVNSNGFAPFVDQGKLRLLVTFGEHRTRRWPQVPTLKELGHGIVASSPYGLAGPRGLPPEVVKVLHEAFRTAMHDPLHVAELERYDQDLAYLGPEDYGRAMRETYAAERRVVERMGLARGTP